MILISLDVQPTFAALVKPCFALNALFNKLHYGIALRVYDS